MIKYNYYSMCVCVEARVHHKMQLSFYEILQKKVNKPDTTNAQKYTKSTEIQ